MQCPNCGFENPEQMKFCGNCAAPLKKKCPNCGFENPPGFKFCGECGTSLTARKPETESRKPGKDLSPQEREAEEEKKEDKIDPDVTPLAERDLSRGLSLDDAERRQITVMFCDLVGSTALSEQLDPEELREVLKAYQEVCAKVINRFEGHIARYFGDGLLVYFGYPLAHEDDAQRAVRTGMGILEAIGRLNLRLQKERNITLSVRLGIHTGLVVAGDITSEGEGEKLESMAIIGETPNIAARLHGIAEPNTLVISAATYRLIQGFFDCQPLGAHTLKGISQPIEVYQVLHESTARSRLDVAAAGGLTPLVGREFAVAQLLECWEQVKGGMGQVVLLSGAAGIGKSRLVRVLKEHAAKDPQAWLTELYCSPYYQNSAFYPIIDLLQRVVLQFAREDSPQERLKKLEGFLVQYGFSLTEALPLFASLLSIPLGDVYSPLKPLNLTPRQQKQKTMEALLTLLLERAAQQPLLLVVEDLHWADPSTLELLSFLIDQAPTTRILTLFTFRPDFSPSWSTRSHLIPLPITRLSPKQVEGMIERITGGKALPAEVIQQVVMKTDGVPLFVEELTKMVLESGLLRERENHYELTAPLPPLAIPTTLQDSLMARLDRLATVKEVAQLAAALGREFTYEMLSAISPLDEATLQRELSRLVEADLLYQRGLPPQATYLFKHALIQEAAYQSLLKSKRQQYHQQIALALAERFPEAVETHPELLAHHYTEAGLNAQAIPYWQRAGQRAIQRSAYLEAINHLTNGLNGLEFLKTLPNTQELISQEIDLQIAIGLPFMITRGYGAPEVEQAYGRALTLCRQAGETPQLFPVLWGLWMHYHIRSDYKTAFDLGQQLLRLAQVVDDPALLLGAHQALGATMYLQGKLATAQEHLEQGLRLYELYEIEQHRKLVLQYSHDPAVFCLSHLAWLLWQRGHPDQARNRIEQALGLCRRLEHPNSLGFALHFSAVLACFRREPQVAEAQADKLSALSVEVGMPHWKALARIVRGWAQQAQGDVESGISEMAEGLAALRKTGAQVSWSHRSSMLVEGLIATGQLDQAEEVLEETKAFIEESDERAYEAEIYRLSGELLRIRGDNLKAAEQCFRQALDIAKAQEAQALALRAAISLGRMLHGGEGAYEAEAEAEAKRILADIYYRFTEGFNLTDLKEAATLLSQLPSP